MTHPRLSHSVLFAASLYYIDQNSGFKPQKHTVGDPMPNFDMLVLVSNQFPLWMFAISG